jgi:uncharacterized protein YbjT (DUF2867 family)
VAAEALLARGQPVRVIVRTAEKGEPWRARGAEVAVADLGDEGAVTEALRGVSGLYTLIPPVFGAADPVAAGTAIGRALARAAKAAHVPHVVLLSSVGAHQPSGTGPIRLLGAAERAFAEAGVPLTAIRAAYFVENWGSVLGAVKADGVLPSFLAAGAPVPQVSTPDIGRLGAELLVEGPRGQRFVELAGPTDPTPDEVAAELAALLGRPVQLVTPPLEAAEGAFTAAGLPPAWASLYAEMYRGIASGVVAFERGAPDRRGSTPLRDTLRALLG